MASTNAASSSSTVVPSITATTTRPSSNLSQPITIKLDDTNFLSWKALVSPAIVGQKLLAFIHNPTPPAPFIANTDGQLVPNPEFEEWRCQDQALLSWIRATLSDSLVAQTVDSSASAELWANLHYSFSVASLAKLDQLYKELQSITKGGSTCKEYIRRLQTIFDELAFLGAPLSETDKIRYTLAGLSTNFNSLLGLLSVPGPSLLVSETFMPTSSPMNLFPPFSLIHLTTLPSSPVPHRILYPLLLQFLLHQP